jgi:hypothetical protein
MRPSWKYKCPISFKLLASGMHSYCLMRPMFSCSNALLCLERNRIVAIFLRKLKYFDGILFLTTNHVADDVV